MTTIPGRRAGVLVLIAATTVALAGCGGGIGAQLTFDDVEKRAVKRIVVTGAGGDVVVSTSPATETRIKRTVVRSGDPGEPYAFDAATGTVRIDTDCGDDCTASYEIEAPAGVAVEGDVSSGDLRLSGTGPVDVETRSGDVSVRGATGTVQVRGHSAGIEVLDSRGDTTVSVTSGDVRVVGVTGAVKLEASSGGLDAANITGPVVAESASGDVRVTLAAPGSVRARASSGGVDVVVPASGRYQVRTDAGSGEEQITGITEDPAAKHILDVAANSGDVRIVGN